MVMKFMYVMPYQTEDAGDRPTGHYDEFGFMADGGTCTHNVTMQYLITLHFCPQVECMVTLNNSGSNTPAKLFISNSEEGEQ